MLSLEVAGAPQAVDDTLDRATLAQACKTRKDYKVVRDMTKEALAAMYGRDLLFPYIMPFSSKEDRLKMRTRCEKTVQHYENYPHEISQTYIEGVFRSGQVVRTSNIAELDDYFKKEFDVTYQNDIAPWLLVMPETFIFLEWPDGPEPVTMADQKAMKMWPRPSIEFGDTIKNVSFDKDGKLNWVSRDMGEYIEILDKKYCYHMQKDGTKVLKITEHGFDGVPCVRARWKENAAYKRKIGHAFLHDVVQKALAVLQFLSMLVEAGYFHLHLQLVMSERTFQRSGAQMGNSNVIIEEADAPATRYLEKPNLEMSVLKELIWIIYPKSIYRSARLRDRSADKTQSGTAKLMDASPEYAALALVADYFQSIDKQVCDLIASAYAGKSVDVTVTYPTSFDLKSVQEVLGNIKALVDLQTESGEVPQSDMLMMKLFEGAVRALIPDVDDKYLQGVLTQLQESLDEEDLEEAASALTPAPIAEGSDPAAIAAGGTIAGEGGSPAAPAKPASKATKTKAAKAPRQAKVPKIPA